MRRSILIVMLDVMVLSVLALTAGKRSGSESDIPIPLYRWATVVEEGLRKEQAYQSEVLRLEEQLARTAELAKQALDQAETARTAASRERSGTQVVERRLHELELESERARAAEALAQQSASQAHRAAEAAELRRAEAEQIAQRAHSETLRWRGVVAQAEADRDRAEQVVYSATSQVEMLRIQLEESDRQLASLRTSESAAQERARVLDEQRARLNEKNEQFAAQVAELSGRLAAVEVQRENAAQAAEQLAREKKAAVAERQKSIWVRREEALRRVNISYTEYNSHNDRNVVTRRELMMPLVQMGRTVLVPADFRKLGLARSFFGGLSDAVTQVDGSVRSLTGAFNAQPLESIVVPGPEPQVCLVRFSGALEGALQSITMEALKERRLTEALLFSSSEVNDHGRVEISPLVGRDYLSVRYASGKKPKVGDYLLSERGEFIGVMVTKNECYVMPHVLSRTPAPIAIPIASRDQNAGYFDEFVVNLNRARKRVDDHLKERKF